MKKQSTIRLLIALMVMITLNASAHGSESEPVEWLKGEAVVTDNTVYVGESFTYKAVITTDNPNIRNISLISSGRSEDNLSLVTRLNTTGRIYKTQKGYYQVEVAAEIFKSNETGNLVIPERTYRVDYIIPTRVYDPFWGYIESGERYSKEVTVKSVKLKSKALPKSPENYSGAIGEFSIVCDTPEVRAVAGGEVSILYTVSGQGILEDVAMPDFRSAMPGEVKLKSVRPDESMFLQNGELISRLTYECRIAVSERGEYTIPPINFTYFSPSEGKYITCKSSECMINSKKSGQSSRSDGQYVYNFEPITTNID